MKIKTMSKGLVLVMSLCALLFGVIAYASSTNVLAVGTIPNSQFFDGPATVTVRTLTISPGEVLGWHYHPGYAFNVVKSGHLTVEEGCGGEVTLGPGDAFEEMDGHVHRAKNLNATEDVVVYNTFIMPQGKPTTVNIPNNERRCGPPSDASECKDNGWTQFTQPNSFSDQGECVDFVRHRARVVLPVPEDPQN
jgi:quercetin dioxygenase-like cupin family protein